MSVTGKWQLTVNTPMGQQTPVLTVNDDGSGGLNSPQGDAALASGKVDGETLNAQVTLKIMGRDIDATIEATADGDSISGSIKTPLGSSNFTGARA